jgi:adenine-specific DNA-methyltransferase
MNKPDLIRKIKTLEALTNIEKADLIALLNNTKKYGLLWEDKPEDVEHILPEPIVQFIPLFIIAGLTRDYLSLHGN